MPEVVLFHHALGLTDGLLAMAEQMRRAGHIVHTPDLFDGRTFDDVHEGVAFAESLGTESIIDRAAAAVRELPDDLVYCGASLGALPAQALAQTRGGARGAILYYGAVDPEFLGSGWPVGLPLQMHISQDDPWGDTPVCQHLADTIDSAVLYLYPGDAHLFAEIGSADFRPESAELCMARALEFLAGLQGVQART